VIVCEGCWGALLTLVVIYPIAYMLPGKDHGSFENPFDAMAMIYNSRLLQSMTVAFVLSVTAYNCLAVYLTKYLSAIWHAILDSFRPVTIWAFGLLIHYFINASKPSSPLCLSISRLTRFLLSAPVAYGEAWVNGSSLQLVGLLILLFGTAVYNGSIVLFAEDDYQPLEDSGNEVQPETELAMAPVSR
jgi:hypothetical protein